MLRGGSMSMYIIIENSAYNKTYTVINVGRNTWRNSYLDKYVSSLRNPEEDFGMDNMLPYSIEVYKANYKRLMKALDKNDLSFPEISTLIQEKFLEDPKSTLYISIR